MFKRINLIKKDSVQINEYNNEIDVRASVNDDSENSKQASSNSSANNDEEEAIMDTSNAVSSANTSYNQSDTFVDEGGKSGIVSSIIGIAKSGSNFSRKSGASSAKESSQYTNGSSKDSGDGGESTDENSSNANSSSNVSSSNSSGSSDSSNESGDAEDDEEGIDDGKQDGHILTWTNVNMKIKSKSAIRKHALENLEGSILPGQLTAIMGHSGAGKTSLLNILAGKIQSNGNISVAYDIQLDGEKVTPAAITLRRKIAFVAQRDVLMLTSTPREAIRFSGRLRLPKTTSDNKIDKLTKNILKELGLTHVADAMIGKLSGGEMRRTSLGIELITRPSVVLLDEVTSGLDSYNAMRTLEVLKSVSKRGSSVLFTLHQPNSQMFATIDHLILMQRGRCMYQGSVLELPNYFSNRGYPVPMNYNPADWILTVSEGMATTEELEQAGFFADYPDAEFRKDFIESALLDIKNEKEDTVASKRFSKAAAMFSSPSSSTRVSTMREINLLLQRGYRNIVRDRKLLMLRFVIVGVGAAIIGIAFHKVGHDSVSSILDFQSHLGATFFLCMAGIIVTQVVLLEFIDERPVMLREYSTDHYRMLSYIISRMVLEGISVFAQVLLFTTITYFALGLQGRFWYLLLCFYTFAMAGASLAVALGSYKSDPRDAKELIPMTMLPQLLFSGFFVSLDDIPTWLRWINHIMPLTYTFRLVITEEFSFCNNPQTLGPIYICYEYLESQEAVPELRARYWGILCAMIVFFRILAFIFLRRQMKVNASRT